MSGKTSISNAKSYKEIGEFWDEQDATEIGEQTDVEFKVNIESQRRYYPVDYQLSFKLKQEAKEHGVSEETLLNLWLQEKISFIEKNKNPNKENELDPSNAAL